MRAQTIIVALVILLAILYLGWQLVNSNLAGKARSTHNKKRKSDRLKLNRAERRAYKHAQKLYQEGNFRACAKILESLGMLRESINILEKAGLIREAADTLIRIQRPNRAGAMLARHGQWKDAMECFKKANMPLEVAKCARELGDLPTAIPYFLDAGAALDAAECYLELSKHHEAAKIFFRNKEHDKAIEQYIHLIDSHPELERLEFAEDEINFITKKLIEGKVDLKLSDILVAKNKSVKLIVELIKAGNLKGATTVYLKSTSDIGPTLIAETEFNRDDNLLLGALFTSAGAYEYGGMIFERLEEFERAGEAFEKGELYDRAAFCFERAQNKVRATDMKILAASRGQGSKSKSPKSSASTSVQAAPARRSIVLENPFAITDTNTDFAEELRRSGQAAHQMPQMMAPADPLQARGFQLPEGFAPPGGVISPPPAPSPQAADNAPANQSINWENFFHAEFMLDLSTPEQQALQAICKTREYPKGSVILDFNQDPLGIYFLLSGNLAVMKLDEIGQDFLADSLEPGDTFGELWLLMDQPTKVKFVAKSNCQLGWIKRADFELLTDKNGAIARKLYKRYALKLVSKLLSEAQPSINRSVS